MTHAELVDLAAKWLKNTKRCTVIVTELCSSYLSETPDALGWKNCNHTVLVECKTSRADFLRDSKKAFRRFWEMGLGQSRFFLCEPGLISPDELPSGWGLLYCHKSKIEVVVDCELKVFNFQVASNDAKILFSMVRRAMIRGFDVQSRFADVLAPRPRRKKRRTTRKRKT